MRTSINFFLVLIFLSSCQFPTETDRDIKKGSEDSLSNNILSEIQGADEYGMKRYIMAFLKRGPVHGLDSIESGKIQRAHLDNINRMAETGKLVIAGPFIDDGEIRGIYVFNVETLEEAEQLSASDPAIQAGVLVMELHPWYGSAALQSINELHKKIAKKDI